MASKISQYDLTLATLMFGSKLVVITTEMGMKKSGMKHNSCIFFFSIQKNSMLVNFQV